MIEQENAGMRDVWCWALSWFRKPPSSTEKRARQTALIAAIKTEMHDVQTVGDLHARYGADSRWALVLAKREFPREWSTLGIHACTAAAFGLRYVEIMTGAALDPHILPPWVGEWAIW